MLNWNGEMGMGTHESSVLFQKMSKQAIQHSKWTYNRTLLSVTTPLMKMLYGLEMVLDAQGMSTLWFMLILLSRQFCFFFLDVQSFGASITHFKQYSWCGWEVIKSVHLVFPSKQGNYGTMSLLSVFVNSTRRPWGQLVVWALFFRSSHVTVITICSSTVYFQPSQLCLI